MKRERIVSVILIFILSMCASAQALAKDQAEGIHITSRKKPEGYELILYDKKNKEVFSEIYPNEPWVVNIEDDIGEIGVSTGNPSKYVFYFDREESKFSDTFFNPILLDNKYVAYMEENKLILTDIFGEGILDTKIVRNYSKMADPISAIISIEILENGDIQLQYYEGEDMEIILEVCPVERNI